MGTSKRAWVLRIAAALFMVVAASRSQGRTTFFVIGLAFLVASLRRQRAAKTPGDA